MEGGMVRILTQEDSLIFLELQWETSWKNTEIPHSSLKKEEQLIQIILNTNGFKVQMQFGQDIGLMDLAKGFMALNHLI